jgi:hypothetical protein
MFLDCGEAKGSGYHRRAMLARMLSPKITPERVRVRVPIGEDRPPSFQEMIRFTEQGRLKWIVVDRLDRFGWKSTKQLFGFLSRLEDAGCRLYDVDGQEWTSEDDSTELQAWVAGCGIGTGSSCAILAAKREYGEYWQFLRA